MGYWIAKDKDDIWDGDTLDKLVNDIIEYYSNAQVVPEHRLQFIYVIERDVKERPLKEKTCNKIAEYIERAVWDSLPEELLLNNALCDYYDNQRKEEALCR